MLSKASDQEIHDKKLESQGYSIFLNIKILWCPILLENTEKLTK